MERMTGMLRGDYLGDGLLAVALTVFGQLNLRFNIDGSTRYGPTFAAAATAERRDRRRPVPERADIKTHVTRILAKFQLRDRVQAVVLAYESGLVQPGAR